VSLSWETSLKIATGTDICSFKVAVLFFTRALSEQKGQRTIKSALGDETTRAVESFLVRTKLVAASLQGMVVRRWAARRSLRQTHYHQSLLDHRCIVTSPLCDCRPCISLHAFVSVVVTIHSSRRLLSSVFCPRVNLHQFSLNMLTNSGWTTKEPRHRCWSEKNTVGSLCDLSCTFSD